MSRAAYSLPRLANYAAGLGVAGIGGALFDWIGTPIPWLLGPLLCVAAFNIAGIRIGSPPGARQTGQIVIGTVIGLYLTPAMALLILSHLPWMALAGLVAIAMGGMAAAVLVRFARLDGPSAFFGSVPGGMAEMLTIGERFNADPAALALAQLTRVTIVVITVPAALTYYGVAGSEVFEPLARNVHGWGLAGLLAGSAVTALILNRLGVTNAWMLGSCSFAALITMAEIELSAIPAPLSMAAQALIGCNVGQRFDRAAVAKAPRVVIGAALTTVGMIGISVALAVLIAAQTGTPLSSMVAAAAPGGLAEMSITAQVLGLGVPLVTAYHVIRVFLITVLTLPLFRLAARLGVAVGTER